MSTCRENGWSEGQEFVMTRNDNGFNRGDRVILCNDDDTSQPEFKHKSDGRVKWVYISSVARYVPPPPPPPRSAEPLKGKAYVTRFPSANDRDVYLSSLKVSGLSESNLGPKGMWVIVFVSFDGYTKTFATFKTEHGTTMVANNHNYHVVKGKYTPPPSVPEKTVVPEEKIEEPIEEIIPETKGIKMPDIKVAKTKQKQIENAKIVAKIEIGRIANAQVTKRIMKSIELPKMLVGYKKQLEPVIRLLVANGGLIVAESMGVENKKAEFILDAMQIAGTQDVLQLINLEETIDNLIGLIDPKLMVRAGIEDAEVVDDDDEDE